MIELLGIVASPRKMGNCELIVKMIAEKMPVPYRLRLVRLVEKEIRPCKACYQCLAGECPLKDDFGGVLSAILESDAVIVAAPSYLHGPNSSLQRFLDRGLQFFKHADALDGKPAVAVAVAGAQDGEGHTLLGAENFLRGMSMELKGRAMIKAALPGEVLLSEEAMASASALALALIGPGPPAAASPSCTVCGGTYFEFRGGNRVYCLLCCGEGSMIIEDGRLQLHVDPPSHSWRGKAAMHAVGDWLRETRERYNRERSRLREAVLSYAGGDFI